MPRELANDDHRRVSKPRERQESIMSSIVGTEQGANGLRVLRIVMWVAMWAWIAFWVWFIAASHLAEGGGALFSEGALVALPLLAGGWLAHRKPILGGAILCLYGVASAIFFHHPVARLVLSAPALLFGLYFALTGSRARRIGAK
jgi:hypothetical protein